MLWQCSKSPLITNPYTYSRRSVICGSIRFMTWTLSTRKRRVYGEVCECCVYVQNMKTNLATLIYVSRVFQTHFYTYALHYPPKKIAYDMRLHLERKGVGHIISSHGYIVVRQTPKNPSVFMSFVSVLDFYISFFHTRSYERSKCRLRVGDWTDWYLGWAGRARLAVHKKHWGQSNPDWPDRTASLTPFWDKIRLGPHDIGVSPLPYTIRTVWTAMSRTCHASSGWHISGTVMIMGKQGKGKI